MPRELTTLDATDLAQAIADGRLTSVDVANAFEQRIVDVDVAVRSVLAVNPDAREIAAKRDSEPPEGALHGVPILLKDNIDTGDSMLTTAGSPALGRAPARSDAFLTARLREAGAVILGKTNLSEWANIRSTHSSSGWSTLGGQTRNPHCLDRTPSGSSSGSAAAVAAELCAAAIGTETDGSIISPASMCGIVGFKPSMGMVSRTGIVPISHSQDTAGPMTRSVRDAALLMSVLSSEDPEDNATHGVDRAPYWLRPLSPNALNGVRVGFLADHAQQHQDLQPILSDIYGWLKGAGAQLVEVPTPKVPHELRTAEFTVMLWELVHDMRAYLARRGQTVDVHSLEEIVRFNREHAAQTMPWFGQELFEQALDVAAQPEEQYQKALATSKDLAGPGGLDRIFSTNDVELIVGLSNGPAAVIDWVNGEGGRHLSLTTMPAVGGYPHLTVPAGAVKGLPIGASFIGRRYTDERLLAFGHAFEVASQARLRPGYRLTIAD